MKYNSTTTLRRIREGSPESGRACPSGYSKLLRYLGKTEADDEHVNLLTVLNSNGLDDALWVLSYAMPDDRLARHFQAWCAEQMVHLFERDRPNDSRVRDQIKMLRDDTATDEARAAAHDAVRDAARDAEWDAARAAWAAARYDAWAVAWAVARESARYAAREAAWDAQENKLREMLDE